jgi:hypothetical protein
MTETTARDALGMGGGGPLVNEVSEVHGDLPCAGGALTVGDSIAFMRHWVVSPSDHLATTRMTAAKSYVSVNMLTKAAHAG